ncbi:kinase-like domain-containing protein [Glomus cerebriforme]|uniref:Kinase-like domain-containing protein n=1 Tax=Glomus cerebriforme TaxID=658196 RepID=A0A397SYC9_9GLOM|nr:kinase-like domain-containing protein [Glomus cerebriforme]
MKIENVNDENFFDPTPKLKSSPIPIMFVSFNEYDDKCVYCGDEYIEALFYVQKYCKKCLLRYITTITTVIADSDTYLDVYYKMKLECSKHEISRKDRTHNIQECCRNCLEILCFKQMLGYDSYTCKVPSYITVHNKMIEIEKYCKLCEKLLKDGTTLCTDCYLISFECIKSALTKKNIQILYLPWWHNIFSCDTCNSKLKFTSDCQKYCEYCYIFYTGCRYCLTTNVIFGPANQSQCKKCKRITSITLDDISSGNELLDEFLFGSRLDIFNNIKITENNFYIQYFIKYFSPYGIYSSIYQNCDFAKIESNLMKWIPYSQFTNVKKIAEGGFGIIYKATWLDRRNRTIILKRFKNFQDISKILLNELKSNQHCYKTSCWKTSKVIRTYGLTKDKDYILIMEYASRGDLHNFLQKNFTYIKWSKKLDTLWDISKGLEYIHNVKYVHRDFHSGNILLDESFSWKIGDLGLSQPANNTSNNEIYGVIPYIAPEIFKGSAFSKESDIYSMGMIMWELTTGCKPFASVEHDHKLIFKILDGERPKITEDTPECFANLMKSCWNPDPKKRPTITKIRNTFRNWSFISFTNKSQEFYKAELKRIELIKSKQLGPEFTEKAHSKGIYTSRLLSSLISKCSSINSSLISFGNMQDYISTELEFDIDTESLPSPILNPIIQNSPTILHSNAIYTGGHSNVLSTSLKKQNVEESNIETHEQ